MIKGPKAILSSAIANALDEYFVVDSGSIESNLLKDAKIVLRHVKLREQVTYIPLNSAGKSTRITIAGRVDEVSFTWAWSVGDVMWVTDAMLTITGSKFQARLEHEDIHEDEGIDGGITTPTTADNEEGLAGSFVNPPSTIDDASAKKIEKQKGGLSGFVERQVKMVMDTLTLRLVDFELRIILPQPPSQLKDTVDNSDVGVSSTSSCNKVMVTSIGKIELLSFGRGEQGEENEVGKASISKLKQRINLHSFACDILLEGKEGRDISYPLLESFSYSADVLRIGERFGGFLTGLEIMGLDKQCPDLPSLMVGSGLAVHMGATQMDTLLLLSVMILAPPDENFSENQRDQPEGSSTLSTNASSCESDEYIFGAHDPTFIVLPLSSASLTIFEEHHFVVTDISMQYKADGTICLMQTGKIEYKSDANGRATLFEVVMTMRPSMKMTIGCLEELLIKDALLLEKPTHSCEILYEGTTIIMRLEDEVDIVTFGKAEDPTETAPVIEKEKDTATETGVYVSMPILPFNMNIFLEKGMQLKKTEDGSMTKVGRCNFYALKEPNCAKVAIQFESFRNYLVSMDTVSCCGTLPKDQVDCVEDFHFFAEEVKVISGYSTDEWSEAFQPRKKQPAKEHAASAKQSKAQRTKATVKMPDSQVEKMKVIIGLGSNKFGVKDTPLVIKPFEGKAETTSDDMINYYTKACLSRAPDFISNAEVLGLNVIDSAAGMLSTWAGLGLGSTFSAGGGVAAITAFDAIKGSVDAGKRRRGVGEAEAYRPGDLLRGLVQAAGEATMHGASIRGNQGKGSIIDWAVGATSDSTDYVKENKNRLGAAGAGGGGFLLGMALGGPIGAVVGGLVATATTGAALEKIDERAEKGKVEEDERLALPAPDSKDAEEGKAKTEKENIPQDRSKEEEGVLLYGDTTDAVDKQIDHMLEMHTESSRKLEAEIQVARDKSRA